MKRPVAGERGQTVVEFGIILSCLLIFTGGLIDVGRAFYQYNAVSTAARYGARWGSVVGGTCAQGIGANSNDWCTQLSAGNRASFWQQLGNKPVQGFGTACPTSFDQAFTGYYKVSDYAPPAAGGSTSSTIVGTIARKFDSNDASPNVITGALTPGFDLTQLKVCIQVSADSTGGPQGYAGNVAVFVYYPFSPAASLLPGGTINLVASSQYQVE